MQTEARVSEEAADWLVRLEEDQNAACREEFFAWLKQSAWHVREFLLATETWQGLEGMDTAKHVDVRKLIDESRNVVRLDAETPPQLSKSRKSSSHYQRRWLIAAALGSLALGTAWLVWRNANPSPYETSVGEQRSFQLDDGSVLHLNARTRVEVRFSEHLRLLRLVDGEALFVVGRDPTRPFRVTAGTATIQALGTQFNVYRRGDGATVSVLEGAVQVSSERQPVRLTAGEEANVGSGGRALRRAMADIPKAIAWRQRQLVFRDDALADVAAEFNRYNRVQIRVEGEAARAKQLIGVFAADDPQSLVLFLEKDASLAIERSGDTIFIRRR
jgi:transmembrane sensor